MQTRQSPAPYVAGCVRVRMVGMAAGRAVEDGLRAPRDTLIGTAKLNDVDPQAWLANVLGRIAGTLQNRLDELLPWNWVPEQRLDQSS